MMLMPMRGALRPNPGMVRKSKGFSTQACVGGLNAVDELADMDPRDALILDNFFPDAYNSQLRRGNVEHVTGLSTSIETLLTWYGPTSQKMFAATNGGIYDVTSAGAVGDALVSGQTSNRWQWTNFSTSGGNFVIAVNGEDDPQNYNGTAWATTPAITGVTPSELVNVCAHKGRLWFVQINTRDAWYLAPGAIGSTATKFPLGAFFTLGGYLQAIGTLSQDSGDGPDDYLCFVSSRGEILVYQGTDPASSSTWALVGRFRVGYPVSRRCLLGLGGDLIITTSDGALSVAKMMQLDRTEAQKAAITYKIQPLFNSAVRDYGSNFGWQAMTYPRGKWALFNIPNSSTRYTQFVMNTITGAWCSFSNMNGVCWGILNEEIYFGSPTGTIFKADTGRMDNNGPITGNLKTSWNYYGMRGTNKRFTMMRPVFQSNGSPGVLVSMNVDFGDETPTGSISFGGSPNSQWAIAQWGTGQWAGINSVTTNWITVGAIGYCAAVRLKAVAQGQELQINSFDIQAEIGGPL